VAVTRWAIICFFAGVTAGFVGIDARATYGARVSADEPQYLLTAISLGEDFNLDISDELEAQRYLPFHEIRVDQQTIDMNSEGQRISPHDPLLPLVLAGPMRLGGWVAAKATLAVMLGLVAAITHRLASRRFGVDPRIAGLVVIAFFVSSPLAAYGSQIYPATLAALCVVVATMGTTGVLQGGRTALAVLAVLALPWLSVKYVPLASVFAVALLVRHLSAAHIRKLAAIVGVFAVASITYAVVHRQIWGGWTVYSSGDHFVDGEFLVVGNNPNYIARSNRLVGLLVDRYFGIAAWAPAYLLAPAGLTALFLHRKRRKWFSSSDSTVLLSAIAVCWAVATWVALTMHGWWWPGRQIVPVLPLVVIGIAVLVERFRFLLWPMMAAGLWGLVNWVWIATEASTDRRALIVDHEDTANPLFQLWSRLLPDHRIDALADQLMTLAWVAVLLVPPLIVVRANRLLNEQSHGCSHVNSEVVK